MGIDIELSIRHLLLDCKEAGIEVELDGENLLVRGNQERTDLYAEIKKHKMIIVQAMTTLPDAVEDYYKPRLQKGRSFILQCIENLKHKPDDSNEKEKLISYLYLWATVDDELRRIYPEFRGCSMVNIGGCDEVPVRCVYCAEKAKEKNDNQT